MEGSVRMDGLEHVPVWKYVKMGGEKIVVCVDEDVKCMRVRPAGVKI